MSKERQRNSTGRPNMVKVGDMWVDGRQFEMVALIQFDDVDTIREAIKTGRIDCDVLGERRSDDV